MKIKNISLLALSLLLSLGALHAVPTDPSSTNNSTENTESSILLTEDDNNQPTQVTVGQTITLMLPNKSHPYTFSDSFLTDVAGSPYIFNWGGVIDDKGVDCVNMAINGNAPLIFQGSSLNCMYVQLPADPANPTTTPDLTYYPLDFYTFVFKPNVAGTTTLTFSNYINKYTYPITVSAAATH